MANDLMVLASSAGWRSLTLAARATLIELLVRGAESPVPGHVAVSSISKVAREAGIDARSFRASIDALARLGWISAAKGEGRKQFIRIDVCKDLFRIGEVVQLRLVPDAPREEAPSPMPALSSLHKRVSDLWDEVFLAKAGSKYAWGGNRESAAVAKLVRFAGGQVFDTPATAQAMSDDDAFDIVRVRLMRFWDDPSVKTRSIQHFVWAWNKYAVAAARNRNTPTPRAEFEGRGGPVEL